MINRGIILAEVLGAGYRQGTTNNVAIAGRSRYTRRLSVRTLLPLMREIVGTN